MTPRPPSPPPFASSSSSHLPGSYPTFSKEDFDSTPCDDPLLHLRIASELNRERSAGPRKRLRRRRVLVGCLSLIIQVWSAFLAGRYFVGFFRELYFLSSYSWDAGLEQNLTGFRFDVGDDAKTEDPSPLSLTSSTPSTKVLALVAFSLSTVVTVTTFLFILLLRYIHRPPNSLPHPKAMIVTLRTILVLSNVLGLLGPAILNLVLVLLWRCLPSCSSSTTGASVGIDVLWISGTGEEGERRCLEPGWRWIVASAGRLLATLTLVALQTTLLYLLFPHLLLPPSSALLPQHTPVEYEEMSREQLLGLSLPQHDHQSHSTAQQEGGWWWGGGGGERVEYLEAEGEEVLAIRSRRDDRGSDLGEVVGVDWDRREENEVDNFVTERRTRRVSADSVSSDVPLLSSPASPSHPYRVASPSPPPSHIVQGRRRGRGHFHQGGRRELSNVLSVGSEGEEEDEDAWEDAREERVSRGGSDWRGKVEVGMGR